MAKFSTYGPNTSKALALVSLNDERPFRAYWPVRFTQIIGGKRWSLSLCTYRTPKPVVIEPRTVSLDEAFGEAQR